MNLSFLWNKKLVDMHETASRISMDKARDVETFYTSSSPWWNIPNHEIASSIDWKVLKANGKEQEKRNKFIVEAL